MFERAASRDTQQLFFSAIDSLLCGGAAEKRQKMLEMLLFQYKDMFGEPFPLRQFAGQPEIDVIDILYDCVSNNRRYVEGMKASVHIDDAPGLHKDDGREAPPEAKPAE